MVVTPVQRHERTSPAGIFLIFLRLGLTSFGGPVAHLAYFRHEFVERRRWLGEQAYADLVALCQFLPGPASSQVGIALGQLRGGLGGAVAAWLGFTLPSALALVLFGLAVTHDLLALNSAWLHGLKVAAVAVVAQAVWSMGHSLCPDGKRRGLALVAAGVLIVQTGVVVQLGVLLAGAVFGWLWLPSPSTLPLSPFPRLLGKPAGAVVLALFFLLLLTMPFLAATGNPVLQLFDSFYRAGSLVFGGGHVVLPVLQAEAVSSAHVGADAFIAGYGAAQAVPGPLFTFSAYLGVLWQPGPGGWSGATVALIGIFLPAFLLVLGVLPWWDAARRHPLMQKAMAGVNASVVGLLLAALYHPVWGSAILNLADFLLALAAFVLLAFKRVPAWLVVLLCALAAGLINT